MNVTSSPATRPSEPPFPNMLWIPGGTFRMGSNEFYPEESPIHEVTVGGFWMDRFTVTNADFKRFVDATNYVTFAQRLPNPADYPGGIPELLANPGSVVFAKPTQRVDLRNHYNWWSYVLGADWRHPEGPDSSIDGRENHPVVHVAFEDVEAYAKWAGKELPTEAEWEFAARGGLESKRYAWGDEFAPGGKMMANTWQGDFPTENLLTDGFERTAPVGSFPPNAYGLHDMGGNVWQWTTDWFQAHAKSAAEPCCAAGRVNPRGGDAAGSIDPRTPDLAIPRKAIKGGSYLCAPNYCLRYRPAARIGQPIDTSTGHVGFRCIVRTTVQ
jgi:formylglycine-generating enzyme